MKDALPTTSLCFNRWNYYIYDVLRDRLKMCCRTEYSAGHSYEDDWDYNLKQRALMMRGERPKDCRDCWQLEDAGLKSFRHANQDFQQELLSQSQPLALDRPTILELILGTICDLKCKYCGPESSTQWQRELGLPVRNSTLTGDHRVRLTERLKSWWPSVQDLKFIGGEPLLHESFYEILELIQGLGPHPQGRRVQVITNLNAHTRVLERFMTAANRSPNRMLICISNEAIGALSESIRVGLNFERFDHNLDRLLTEVEPRHDIFFLVTLNNDCLPGLHEFFAYVQSKIRKFERAIFLQWNIVQQPLEMSPLQKPEAIKKAITRCQPLFEELFASPRCGPALKKSWRNYWQQLQNIVPK